MVALVTGSSKGIGKTCIIELAKEGYDVVINYNTSKSNALELEKYIKDNFNVKVLTIKCDVSDEENVKNMINTIINKLDSIDIVVNNAAVEINSDFYDKTKESFRKVLDTNLIGTFLVSKYASIYMLKNKFGKIINITSNNGIDKNDPNTLEYDASKAGIISLTHNLAKQLAPIVNVNAIAPGWVKTDKIIELDNSLNNEFIKEESKNIYLGRFAEEIDIANLVVFLASSKANYINNEIIRIDGGTN